MPDRRRLTDCATSDHPDPAVAVGEVVGHLQDSLAGSPQFALVLVDERIDSLLSTIAAAVHGLLGPDLLLAVAGSPVAGAGHLGPTRASVVVWALCGVEVATLDDDDESPNHADGSAIWSALSLQQRRDGSVAVQFHPSPDAPRPVCISGDGRRWRPLTPRIVFPSGSATALRAVGQREVGPTMVATAARGRTLRTLDHVPVRSVLVDQLETTEAFVGGPSIEFPPLRAIVSRPSDPSDSRRTVDVLSVDHQEGSVELAAEVEIGDRIQLVADDPAATTRTVLDRLSTIRSSGLPGDLGVLLSGGLAGAHGDDLDPIAIATITATPIDANAGALGHRPWTEVAALVVHAFDED